MGRYAIGTVVGLAVLLGSALVAEAQVDVDGHGPLAVHVGDSESLYKATVTTDNNFLFTLRVVLVSSLKHYSRTYVVTSGPSYEFSKTVLGMDNWGMAVNDQLDYHGRAQGAQGAPQDHHYVTVQSDPETFKDRSPNRSFEEEYLDRFRGVLA